MHAWHRAAREGRAGGFTLIELMIVVAIVAILAAIAYPSYQEHVRKSRRGQAKADLVEFAQLAERYHTVNNTYAGFTLPATQSPRDGTGFYDLAFVGTPSQSTFTVRAAPRSGTPQAQDRCGTLTINHAGVKTHSAGTDAECQFGRTP
ncbi:type IV pilin protein [Coralloluteibacterium stylophorae]|uniref:Type IV pilin protein n=1 Tax=Coralloluteibacterium stylophorae TaxID=1776034 RepID=A0A8J7VRC1_9GAMM|nr:type IV pilin protein [Coralloluteibacterium stylophorae]MBS7456661.1 type IV pilin protein [Coralloluteibacterium stylophorae]